MDQEVINEINRKLDLIISAFGLNNNHKLTPSEIKEKADNIVLQFKRKNGNGSKYER